MEHLARIQKELKAPKDKRNNFGGYNYRSAESILEAVKPLLQGCLLTLEDEVVNVGERYYIKATARFVDGDKTYSVSAYAREATERKGMDESQLTGACSSYARKYALGGLFLIDDGNDADSISTEQKVSKTALKIGSDAYRKCVVALKGEYTMDQIREKYEVDKETEKRLLEDALA